MNLGARIDMLRIMTLETKRVTKPLAIVSRSPPSITASLLPKSGCGTPSSHEQCHLHAHIHAINPTCQACTLHRASVKLQTPHCQVKQATHRGLGRLRYQWCLTQVSLLVEDVCRSIIAWKFSRGWASVRGCAACWGWALLTPTWVAYKTLCAAAPTAAHPSRRRRTAPRARSGLRHDYRMCRAS